MLTNLTYLFFIVSAHALHQKTLCFWGFDTIRTTYKKQVFLETSTTPRKAEFTTHPSQN